MNTSVDRNLLLFTLLTLCAISFCIFTDDPSFSLLFTFVCGVLLVKSFVKKYGSAFSISTIFAGFACLYAVSGPISVIFTGELTAPFFGPYNINEYILLHNLGMLGLVMGSLVLPTKISRPDNENLGSQKYNIYNSKTSILVLSTTASVFEAINFFRVGGLGLISQGKSAYQGAVADVPLTLPASYVAVAAFALAGLLVGALVRKDRKADAFKITVLCIVLSSCEIILNIILGQRMELFSYIIAFTLGYTTHRKMGYISLKHVLVLVCVYLSSVALYSYRWLLPQIATSQGYVYADYTKINNSMLNSINPGKSEFGAPFGNFTMYKNLLNYPVQLGATYLAGATIPIPALLFPGEKPLDITYVYRDDIAVTNVNSSISGTGFSSLLESFINFSWLGPFVIYFVIGIAMNFLESIRYSRNMLLSTCYVFVSPLAMTFHRSGSGFVFSLLSWLPLVWFIIYISVTIFRRASQEKGIHNLSSS